MKLIELLQRIENGELKGKKISNGTGSEYIVKNLQIFEISGKVARLRPDLEYKIIEEVKGRWKPEYEKQYLCIDDAGYFDCSCWANDEIDNYRYNTNNCFKTEEEAEFRKQQLIYETMVKDMSYEFSEEEWRNTVIDKYYIQIYYHGNFKESFEEFKIFCTHYNCIGKYYFETEEDAQNCLDTIGKDNYKKYILEIK